MSRPYRILVWADLSAHWGRQLIHGVSEAMPRQPPWMLKVIGSPVELEAAINKFRPEGMILPHWLDEEYALVREHDIPTVTVFTEQSTSDGSPVLACDNLAIGALGAHHLLQTRLETIAFIGGQDPMFSLRRMEGFQSELDATRRTCEWIPFPNRNYGALPDPFAADAKRSKFARQLLDLPRPCAVMCAQDIVAHTTALFCIRLGLRIPQDIAILGVDDDDILCRSLIPNLSSIRLPFARIGMDAARLLIAWLGGNTPPPGPPRLYAPAEVAVRESTSVQAVPDPIVSLALAHLEQHPGGRVSVRELVRLTGVSHSTLDKHFTEALGRTPLMEIRRRRLVEAKRLLHETQLSIGEIARQCGYGSLVRFSFVFREMAGLSPSEYRRSLPY